GAVRVVTATGHPAAVERSAREAGFEIAGVSAYRDHHAFTAAEAGRERAAARAAGARVLITAKDAVRWPRVADEGDVRVLEVHWRWVCGGERVERMVRGGGGA
ncbi:MAG TPA: tetraacyldisaccharide 4'-kinase, partial [Candidatus Eisenbacteria bacterium]|nr:tetraacyldisaccharide 4'-kinase [Candidatus Eisenbacteria bacterium]